MIPFNGLKQGIDPKHPVDVIETSFKLQIHPNINLRKGDQIISNHILFKHFSCLLTQYHWYLWDNSP